MGVASSGGKHGSLPEPFGEDDGNAKTTAPRYWEFSAITRIASGCSKTKVKTRVEALSKIVARDINQVEVEVLV